MDGFFQVADNNSIFECESKAYFNEDIWSIIATRELKHSAIDPEHFFIKIKFTPLTLPSIKISLP